MYNPGPYYFMQGQGLSLKLLYNEYINTWTYKPSVKICVCSLTKLDKLWPSMGEIYIHYQWVKLFWRDIELKLILKKNI
jgi:hypothetical protein